MKKVVIILYCLAMFFPWFSSLEHTYQTSLWTYSDHRRGGEVSNDCQFRIGGETTSMKWTRVQLGIQIQPITIDVQGSTGIVQVRIGTINFLWNLLPVSLLVVLVVVARWGWQGALARRALRDPAVTQ